MTTRLALLAHLAALADAGHLAPCLEPPNGDWTSDDPTAQRAAAALCGPCPALERCHEYGTTNPKEWGVYGGQTVAERHRKPITKEN